MISVRHLKKSYRDVTPLKDVSFDIEKGEVISVIGSSGSGKSTLLRCLNLLETPSAGEILVDGQNILAKSTDIPKVRQKMGMVFQSINLFSHLTVIENIMLGPLNLLKVTPQQAYDQGMRLLDHVGLAEKSLSYPGELSGGQKQRVGIARAIAMKPEIILFDEPTSALDPTMVGEVLTVIRTLAKEGLTMMIVTHEMNFARDVSSRILYMDEGGIYEDGPPEQIFDKPKKERTRAFIRQLKTFERIISSPSLDYPEIISAIEDFGRKQLLSQRQISTLQLVFEELCIQMLLQRESAIFPIQFVIEVSYADGTCDVIISYGGPAFNPFVEQTEELPIILVGRLVKSHQWKHQDRNQLNLTL